MAAVSASAPYIPPFSILPSSTLASHSRTFSKAVALPKQRRDSHHNGGVTKLTLSQQPHQPRPFQNNGYLPNGVPDNSFAPGPHSAPFTNNQARVIQTGASRILCVADVRGV